MARSATVKDKSPAESNGSPVLTNGSHAAAAPQASTLAEAHDAGHQALLLREALQSDKARVGFFLGAGCPLGIYDESGTTSLRHIPDVA